MESAGEQVEVEAGVAEAEGMSIVEVAAQVVQEEV